LVAIPLQPKANPAPTIVIAAGEWRENARSA
jgi:hypothetical protein